MQEFEMEVLHHLWHDDSRHPEVNSEFEATVTLFKEVFTCQGCGGRISITPLQFKGAPGPDDRVIARTSQKQTEPLM